MANGRLLFIDLLRIVGISLIIIHHLYYYGGWTYFPWIYISFHYPARAAFHIDLGSIGVWLFIFASGASLALSKYSFGSLKNVGKFYGNRLLRIYPIYWVAVYFQYIDYTRNLYIDIFRLYKMVFWVSNIFHHG
jgi:peptidoglycan/LPS O-acetylase OafA/YrhL